MAEPNRGGPPRPSWIARIALRRLLPEHERRALLSELAELYERHYQTVFRAALRVTGNPADAEDVLQTVFMRVMSGGGVVEEVAVPAAYFPAQPSTRPSTCCAAGRFARNRPTTIKGPASSSSPHCC